MDFPDANVMKIEAKLTAFIPIPMWFILTTPSKGERGAKWVVTRLVEKLFIGEASVGQLSLGYSADDCHAKVYSTLDTLEGVETWQASLDELTRLASLDFHEFYNSYGDIIDSAMMLNRPHPNDQGNYQAYTWVMERVQEINGIGQ